MAEDKGVFDFHYEGYVGRVADRGEGVDLKIATSNAGPHVGVESVHFVLNKGNLVPQDPRLTVLGVEMRVLSEFVNRREE